jgi:hypothetical protein
MAIVYAAATMPVHGDFGLIWIKPWRASSQAAPFDLVANPSGQLKRHVHDAARTPCVDRQATPLEHLQHCGIAGQNIGDQFHKAGVLRDCDEMAHQQPADRLSLVVVDHGEGELSLARLNHNVTPAADDPRPPVLCNDRDQGDMADKVDIDEKVDFLVGEVALYPEKPPIKRLRAGPINGGQKLGLIIGPQRPNFQPASVAQHFNRRVIGRAWAADLIPARHIWPRGRAGSSQGPHGPKNMPTEKYKAGFDLDQTGLPVAPRYC